MLILLPPSEGKASPSKGARLTLSGLSHPALTPSRTTVLDALIALCCGPTGKARGALGLGPKQSGEIAHNAQLRRAPTAPAIEIYTGVLFEALAADTLGAAARKRLNTHVLIASALFGFVSPSDRIPSYRLSGDVTLPGVGPLPALWRAALSAVLASYPGVILDLRSGIYTKLGPIPAETAHRSFVGRVLLERDGKRSVVSHHNKATKGQLVRALVERGPLPKTETALTKALTDLGYLIELHEAPKAGQPATLDIIVTHT